MCSTSVFASAMIVVFNVNIIVMISVFMFKHFFVWQCGRFLIFRTIPSVCLLMVQRYYLYCVISRTKFHKTFSCNRHLGIHCAYFLYYQMPKSWMFNTSTEYVYPLFFIHVVGNVNEKNFCIHQLFQLKIVLKKIKTKSDNMVVNDIKISLKMKNKG